MLKRLVSDYWPFALLFVLIVVILCLSHEAERRKTENQEYAQVSSPQTAIAPLNASKGTKQADKPKYPPSWINTFTWSDGVTAWALILTLFVIAWQSIETRKAAKATERSVQIIIDKERARLRIEVHPLAYTVQTGPGRNLRYMKEEFDAIPLREVESLIRSNDVEYAEAAEYFHPTGRISIGPEVEYSIIHDGETSAFLISAVVDVQVRDSEKVTFQEAFQLMKLPNVIKNGDNAVRRFLLIDPLLTGDVLEDVKARRKFIHFYGMVSYRDVFREDRQSAFYYTWRVLNHPAAPRHHPDHWIKRTCPGYDQET